MSKLEEQIIRILQKSKVKFEREVSYKDLGRGKYRFDFRVLRNGAPVLIEIQGRQHYEFVPKFHRTRSDFTQQQGRDRRKISYCLAHKIPLYIIPYWEVENLKSANDLFKDKFRAKNQWKNQMDWSLFKK